MELGVVVVVLAVLHLLYRQALTQMEGMGAQQLFLLSQEHQLHMLAAEAEEQIVGIHHQMALVV
jgi:hypothetical protein